MSTTATPRQGGSDAPSAIPATSRRSTRGGCHQPRRQPGPAAGRRRHDWVFDRVDTLGGADHRRRLVEQAAGELLEIGAGTGRNPPR
jgi:hypothetical protein